VTNQSTAILVPLARLLFASIFLFYGPRNFTDFNIQLGANAGMPMPNLVVPIGGIIAIVGAVSVVLGYKARIGAVLLILFLVPATLFVHRFWALEGAAQQEQIANFLRNTSLIGGALFLCHFGAGPYSLDARGARGHSRGGVERQLI
jgi:putative oxidoreductase